MARNNQRFRVDHLEYCLNARTFPLLLFWISSDVFLVRMTCVNNTNWTPDLAQHLVHWDRLKGREPGTGTKYYSDSRHRYVMNLDKMVASGLLEEILVGDKDFKAYRFLPAGTRCLLQQTPSPVPSPEVQYDDNLESITKMSVSQATTTQNDDLLGLAMQESNVCLGSGCSCCTPNVNIHGSMQEGHASSNNDVVMSEEAIPYAVTSVNASSSETLQTVQSDSFGISSPRDSIAPQLSIESRSDVLEMSSTRGITNSSTQLQEIVSMNGFDVTKHFDDIINDLKSVEETYNRNLDKNVCNSPRQTNSVQGATNIGNSVNQEADCNDFPRWYENFVNIPDLIPQENIQNVCNNSIVEESMDGSEQLDENMYGHIDFSALTDDNSVQMDFKSIYGTAPTGDISIQTVPGQGSTDSDTLITNSVGHYLPIAASGWNEHSFYDSIIPQEMELDDPDWSN